MNKALLGFWADNRAFFPDHVAEDEAMSDLNISWNSLAGAKIKKTAYCHAYERGRAEALAKDWDAPGFRSYSKSSQFLNLTCGQRSARSQLARAL